MSFEFFGDEYAEETRELNNLIIRTLTDAPDQWSFPPAEIRRRRRAGQPPFPRGPLSELATEREIDGPHGRIPLRILRAANPRGVFLHMHGGGWTLGGADFQDKMLERIVKNTEFTAISIEYRLAPEAPYPQGIDDCEAVAIWLAQNGQALFGVDRFVIGGESAGAHLSVMTMLRLRDRHGLKPFRAAILGSGCFDLRMSASMRNWGNEKLILTTPDTKKFIDNFLNGASPDNADVSPLLADITGLPRALFFVGTRDALLDDTLMMAARWSAHNETELAVFREGAHVFVLGPGKLASAGISRMEAFLNSVT